MMSRDKAKKVPDLTIMTEANGFVVRPNSGNDQGFGPSEYHVFQSFRELIIYLEEVLPYRYVNKLYSDEEVENF